MKATAPPRGRNVDAAQGVAPCELDLERARLYRSTLVSAVGGQLVVVPLVLAVLWTSSSAAALAGWLAVLVATLALRLGLARPLWRRPWPQGAALAALVRRLRAGVWSSGAAWGLAGWALFPAGDLQGQTFLLFVLAGMGAGSLTLSSFDLRAALGFALLALAPAVLRLVAEGTATGLSMALMGSLFTLFLATVGWRAQRHLLETLAARAAEARRTQELTANQQRLQQLSDELATKSTALQLTLDNMEQGILSLGADGHTHFYNRRLLDLLDLPEAFMASGPTMDEIAQYQQAQGHYGPQLALVDESARGALAQWLGGERVHLPDRYLRRTVQGQVLEVRSHRLASGALVRTFADVTAYVDAQQALQASQAQAAKLALVAAHTNDAVVILDPDRRIEWVNEGFTRMTGYPLHEARGRFPVQLLHLQGLDIEQVARLDEKLLASGSCEGELHQRARSGRLYWCALEVQAIRDESGRVTQYISISRDVSARKADEQALRSARDEAERASRAKSDFLSAMSHELRTPMNAILGFAQLLQLDREAPLPPRQRDQVQQILRAGSHLLTLIDDVLDLARVEAGKQPIAAEPVALAPLLQDCVALVQPLAQARDIALVVEAVPADANAWHALADRTRLRQVLLNLLSNAIKYNREGGAVRLAVQPRGDEIVLAVTDTGAGLDAAERERLFQPFDRLGAEGGPVPGAGIGLALSRQLMALMHGRIEVDSRPGEGSTFTLVMPRAAPEGAGALPADSAPAPAPTLSLPRMQADSAPVAEPVADPAGAPACGTASAASPRRVLYIEDNPVNLMLMEAALQQDPTVRLSTAPLPQLGLDLAQADPPDLVLLDIQLPGMDGFEVLRQLRADARTAAVPVVAVSANAMPGDVARAREAGFDGYLTKPLDIAQLRAAVHDDWRARGR